MADQPYLGDTYHCLRFGAKPRAQERVSHPFFEERARYNIRLGSFAAKATRYSRSASTTVESVKGKVSPNPARPADRAANRAAGIFLDLPKGFRIGPEWK